MADRLRFPFVPVHNIRGEVVLRPQLPLTLRHRAQVRTVSGLLDSGADVNVLPFRLGLELGAVWEEQRTIIQLSGNLTNFEARGILLTATVDKLKPVRLAFAWTNAEDVPLILGQVNFFAEFDVCFFRATDVFEVGERVILDAGARSPEPRP